MAYVKISDPNIIDLGAIHNIINVVNQHSDTLNTLTNNFGSFSSSTVNYNAEATQNLFDSGTQMIIYGRATFNSSNSKTAITTYASMQGSPSAAAATTGSVYYQTVTFSNSTTGLPPFTSAAPIVFAQVHVGNVSSGVSTSYWDATLQVYSPTTAGFGLKLILPKDSAIGSSDKIYVNWMAVGPKNK